MTEAEFKQNESLVSDALMLLNHPTMQIMLEIIDQDNPANYRIPLKPGPDDANHRLGWVWGWANFRERLLSFKKPLPIVDPTEEINVTWGEEEDHERR